MNLTTKLMGLALALVIAASPAIAQQGEGTGGDFDLSTQRNIEASTQDDKFLCVGDGITITFSSTSLSDGVAAFGDISPVSVDILENAGLGLGLGTGVNRFGIFDGISDPLGPAMVGGNLTLAFSVPASQDWIDGGAFANNPDAGLIVADDWGFFLQGVTLDPTGPFGVQVSNTIKHEIGNELGDGFSDNCADALMCDGLTDLDLGISQLVDTSLYQNDVSIDDMGEPFGSQNTIFAVGAPGQFTRNNSNDAFVTFTTATGGNFNFNLCASAYDTAIYLIDTDCTTGIIYNEDNDAACGTVSQFRSVIESVNLTAGQTVIVGIDGFGGGSDGLADLVITKLPDFNVVSLDLNSGDIAGGEVVTLTGTGINLITDVTFGGVSGTSLTIIDPMTATIVVPAGAAGSVDVVVTDGVDTQTFVGGWTYVDNSAPSFSECNMPGTVFGQDNANPAQPPMISDTITVAAGAGAEIAAGTLTVDLDISHTWLSDMTIDLTAPDGVTVFNLWANDGGSGDDLIGTYPGGTNLGGSGEALNPDGAGDFSELNGTSPNGDWVLTINDPVNQDPGTLNMWCVNGDLSFAAANGMSAPGTVIPTTAPPNMISDTITIADDTTIGSLTVDVDISHTWVGDLEIDLTSPALTTVRLIDNSNGNTDDLIGTYPGGTNMGATPFALDPLGNGDFSEFFGESTMGDWILDINDTANGDGGSLNS